VVAGRSNSAGPDGSTAGPDGGTAGSGSGRRRGRAMSGRRRWDQVVAQHDRARPRRAASGPAVARQASGRWQAVGAHLNFGNEMPREALTLLVKN
jgi:hypothetical protein